MTPRSRLGPISSKMAHGVWVLALVATLTGACRGASQAAAAPEDVSADETLIAGAVHRGEFRRVLLLTGELRARRGEQISVPRLPSWETTIRWMVADGSRVAEGDRLMELDTSQIASELNNNITARQQARNTLASTEAEIAGQIAQKRLAVERARVKLEKARIEADVPAEIRTRKQHREAQLAFEQAQTDYDKAVADLEGTRQASEARLAVLRIDLEKAERQVQESQRAIEAMVLRAPQSGIAVVAENRRVGRKFQVGDTVWVGAHVIEIPDLSEMSVQARLSDVDDGKIVPGMTLVCTLDAYPDRPIPGVVRTIGPVAQEANIRSLRRHFNVWVDLLESDPARMRPGMSAKLEVQAVHLPGVLLAPRAALRFGDQGSQLRMRDGSLVPVALGPCNAFECVLQQGPPEGTPVWVRP